MAAKATNGSDGDKRDKSEDNICMGCGRPLGDGIRFCVACGRNNFDAYAGAEMLGRTEMQRDSKMKWWRKMIYWYRRLNRLGR